MKKVVGVNFNENGKVYVFSCNNLDISKDNNVIVETDRGLQYGQVVGEPYDISEDDFGLSLKNVIRIADNNDKKQYLKNIKDSETALLKAREIVDTLKLDMRLIDASYTFDRDQLLFHFLADARVDFRELAKKLAQIYRTRIELRQIGVRDKAKVVGGIGPCGRFLCCNTFLNDFNSVSINMVKNQMLALNPTKINGVCGRLLCCLSYEDDVYTAEKKNMPSVGEIYKKDGIEGKIISINILKKTITIETSDKTIIEVEV